MNVNRKSNLTLDQISIRPIGEGTPQRHLLKLDEMGVHPKKHPKVRFSILLNCCSSKKRYL
ncbi:hypothetical protein V1477_016191 [Vespula maculifrons]|uniref:Uncharacterized protein n=1 Tax=Vespula maculifrons TaxID=7453 RepID=A0ABD2BCI9_VESMC